MLKEGLGTTKYCGVKRVAGGTEGAKPNSKGGTSGMDSCLSRLRPVTGEDKGGRKLNGYDACDSVNRHTNGRV